MLHEDGFSLFWTIIIFSHKVLSETGYVSLETIIKCPLTDNLPKWRGPPSGTIYSNQDSPVINPNLAKRDRLSINEKGDLVIKDTQLTDAGEYMCAYSALGSFTETLNIQAIPEAPVLDNAETKGGRSLLWGVESMPLTITCTSTGGYPAPQLSFWIGSKLMQKSTDNDALKKDDGTFRVVLRLLITPERKDDRLNVSCHLSHPAISGSLAIYSMLYLSLKPSGPLLSGSTQTEEGSIASVRCSVSDCRPPANISLFINTKPVATSIHTDYSVTTETYNTSSVWIKTLQRGDNGRVIHCSVQHEALKNPLVATAVLDVQFAPKQATLTGNKQVIADGINVLILTCTSGTANPPADIKWRLGDLDISNSEPVSHQSGDYNGFLTSQDLHLSPTRDMDGQRVLCQASSEVLMEIVNASVSLSLFYAVHTVLVNGPAVHAVNGDDDAVLTCKVESKPGATLKWYKENETVILAQVTGLGSIVRLDLVINNVVPGDAGMYICVANNGLGADVQANISLIVKCVPGRPKNLVISNITSSSLTVSWQDGPDCGLKLNFVVQYSQEFNIWRNSLEITDERKTDTAIFTGTIGSLKESTLYFIRVYAHNAEGQGHFAGPVNATTLHIRQDHENTPKSMKAAIAGGVVGGILVVLLVVTGVAILRKYQIKCIPKSSGNLNDRSDSTSQSAQDVQMAVKVMSSGQYKNKQDIKPGADGAYANLQLEGATSGPQYEPLHTSEQRDGQYSALTTNELSSRQYESLHTSEQRDGQYSALTTNELSSRQYESLHTSEQRDGQYSALTTNEQSSHQYESLHTSEQRDGQYSALTTNELSSRQYESLHTSEQRDGQYSALTTNEQSSHQYESLHSTERIENAYEQLSN